MFTEIPDVFCAAQSKGGVYDMDVALDFVATVTCAAEPHLSLMVCVKVLTARVTVSEPAEPSTSPDADTDDARGISGRLTVPETVRLDGV